jgi:hypothetical protein
MELRRRSFSRVGRRVNHSGTSRAKKVRQNQRESHRKRSRPVVNDVRTPRQVALRRLLHQYKVAPAESWEKKENRAQEQQRAARVAAYVESRLSADTFDGATDLPTRDIESSVVESLTRETAAGPLLAATLRENRHRAELFRLAGLFEQHHE